MKRGFVLTQQQFDNLLHWFSPDRDSAGEEYEKIRNGLVRYFRYRGCNDPHALADETLNRVAVKISSPDVDVKELSVNYIYGFASNIFHEYLRESAQREVQLDLSLPFKSKDSADAATEAEKRVFSCLDECLGELKPEDKKLVISYYSKNKSEKFDHRKKLADKLDIRIGTLHTRVHRLKNSLKECLENCSKRN